MTSVLRGPPGALLMDYARSRVLLGLDFDGTLAPIVARPAQARMWPSTRRLLARAAGLYPVAVISGRSMADVAARVRGIPLQAVVGNHGLEPAAAPGIFERVTQRWRTLLEELVGAHPGTELEDKRYSLALHYRRSRARKRVLQDLERVLPLLGPVRVIAGKQVVNFLPPDAPHKGLALERIRRRLGCDTAIYVGDDETDEDVFSMEVPGRLLGIRVGARAGSAAPFSIPGQRSIDRLLRFLVRAREGEWSGLEATG
ncbi:MAG TPA: trehalose-phosphatase [Myxococcaceae bacterium]|jgi:trehalose 6-phosphate phosphatase